METASESIKQEQEDQRREPVTIRDGVAAICESIALSMYSNSVPWYLYEHHRRSKMVQRKWPQY